MSEKTLNILKKLLTFKSSKNLRHVNSIFKKNATTLNNIELLYITSQYHIVFKNRNTIALMARVATQ
jgi:hypothetical protein